MGKNATPTLPSVCELQGSKELLKETRESPKNVSSAWSRTAQDNQDVKCRKD